jgi:uncharacterized membrane protein YidH (DUF202 family)
MTALFDPALQPERTELAWRRTALAIGIGSLIALRLLPFALGSPWWTLAGVGGVIAATILSCAARLRHLAVTRALASGGDHAALPGGSPMAAVAGTVAVTGIAAAAIVIWSFVSPV